MKKLIYLLIVSSVLISCGSSNSSLSQFSKRKYLKKYKPSKRIKDAPINTYAFEQEETHGAVYAAEEIQPEHVVLNKIVEEDYTELVLPQIQDVVPLKREEIHSFSKPKNIFNLKDGNEVPIKRKLHSWSIVTIVMLGLAIPTFGISLAVGFVTGLIALSKINKYPEKYKGRGWSSLAIGLGIIGMAILTLFIYLLNTLGNT